MPPLGIFTLARRTSCLTRTPWLLHNRLYIIGSFFGRSPHLSATGLCLRGWQGAGGRSACPPGPTRPPPTPRFKQSILLGIYIERTGARKAFFVFSFVFPKIVDCLTSGGSACLPPRGAPFIPSLSTGLVCKLSSTVNVGMKSSHEVLVGFVFVCGGLYVKRKGRSSSGRILHHLGAGFILLWATPPKYVASL